MTTTLNSVTRTGTDGAVHQIYALDNQEIVDINWRDGQITIDTGGLYKDENKHLWTMGCVNAVIRYHGASVVFDNCVWWLRHAGQHTQFKDGLSFRW